MTALSPTLVNEPGEVRPGLAGSKTNKTSRKVTQRPKQTVDELAPLSDLIPNTGRNLELTRGLLARR